jgi:flagellum-specific peptidoglycan hydrolase FlgJ
MDFLRRSLAPLVGLLTVIGAAAAFLTAPRSAEAAPLQETFIASISAAAQQNQARFGVPASVTMGQAILESGWGRSGLSTKYKNYFGIKCSSTPSPYQSGCVNLASTEYEGPSNTPVVRYSNFRTYSSIENSFADHANLFITLSRYSKAFDYKQDPDQFIREIHKAGYATDQNYASTVISLMKSYNLYQYNVTPPEPSRTATSAQKQAFFSRLGATAQQAHLTSGVPASVVLSQAAYHSNYGLSQLTAKTNNYFGLTCTSTRSPYQTGCHTVYTSVPGSNTFVTTSYRTYPNFTASIKDLAHLYSTNSRYSKTRVYPNAPESFLNAVGQAGYGGADYFTSVRSVMRANELYRYDTPFTTLRQGNKGFKVTALQRLLSADGPWIVTGTYDARTTEAVKAFQRKAGVGVTGIASPETIRLLTVKYNPNVTDQRVAALQVLLNGKGYPTKVWGYFDGVTATRVSQFNAANYGPSGSAATIVTWGKLFS